MRKAKHQLAGHDARDNPPRCAHQPWNRRSPRRCCLRAGTGSAALVWWQTLRVTRLCLRQQQVIPGGSASCPTAISSMHAGVPGYVAFVVGPLRSHTATNGTPASESGHQFRARHTNSRCVASTSPATTGTSIRFLCYMHLSTNSLMAVSQHGDSATAWSGRLDFSVTRTKMPATSRHDTVANVGNPALRSRCGAPATAAQIWLTRCACPQSASGARPRRS